MKDTEKEVLESKGLFTGSLSQVGQVFGIKVGSNWVRGKFKATNLYGGYSRTFGMKKSRTLTRFEFINLKSGRDVILKSKQKIAGRIIEAE